MRHALWMVMLGLGGLSLAVALSLGAFALAGNSLREPISPVVLSKSSPRTGSQAATSPTASPEKHHGGGSDTDTATAPPATSAPSDDHNPRPGGGHGGDD